MILIATLPSNDGMDTLRAAVATAMDRQQGARAVAEGYRAAAGPAAAASHLEALPGEGTLAAAQHGE
jgi:hypothetical protein